MPLLYCGMWHSSDRMIVSDITICDYFCVCFDACLPVTKRTETVIVHKQFTDTAAHLKFSELASNSHLTGINATLNEIADSFNNNFVKYCSPVKGEKEIL